MSRRPEQLAAALHRQRDAFRAFVAARAGSAADAEDILQQGLLRAMQRAGDLRDEARLTAWFHQILRHAVIDHYRSRSAARRRDETLGATLAALGEDVVAAPSGWRREICRCLGGLVDALPRRHAELLRRVDLAGESVQAAARALQMTANNASVTLHRARKELRGRLEAFCGECATNACLECDCVERGKSV